MGKRSPVDAGHRTTGTLFVLSAPSGTGKTTICGRVCQLVPDIVFSVSYTTRVPRSGERQGLDYYFVTKDVFERKIEADKWAEWARVHDNYYGTSAEFLDAAIARQQTVLLDIDVQGASQIRKRYPDCVTIFIMPPSMKALQVRLESRQTDDAATIQKRLANAKKEIAQKELYHHIIVNDDLQTAVDEMVSLILQYSR
ncbi:MAG: guanylate kinase [Desulfobacterales bacterium]|nr:guanylate kinase [Desulfobacterales bacterium]